MLAIEMLQGGHGDALVVEYGKGNRVRRLLVDAGTAHAYDAVRKRLLARRDARYDAFVITHVDEDHIGHVGIRVKFRRRGWNHSKLSSHITSPYLRVSLTKTPASFVRLNIVAKCRPLKQKE